MERWAGKVAVITGASSGIGLTIAKALVQQGLVVVGLARRKAQMEEGMKDVRGSGKFYAKECDVTNERSVIESLNWVKNTLGSLNILINNAGVIKQKKIEEVATAELEEVIKVNILGVLYCTKHAIPLLRENQKEAHIININSVLGHKVPTPMPRQLNVYPASKFAITALSETLRNELNDSKIRVTSVSPGLAKTEMRKAGIKVFPNLAKMPALNPEDIASSIVYALGVPSHVEIHEITMQAKL